jgi:hypothetical protein
MKRIIPICLISTLFATSLALAPRAAAAEKKPQSAAATSRANVTKAASKKKTLPKKKALKATALVDNMRKSAAYIVKTSKANKGGQLDPKKKAQRPFWSALKTIDQNAKAMKKAIPAKDPKFFTLLDQTGRAAAQLNHGAQLMRLKDKKALAGVRALSTSYNELQKNFGKVAARKKKGGELSAKEREQLARMRSESKALQARLKAMQAKIDKKKNARLYAQLMDLLALSARIAGINGDSLDAWAQALYWSDYLTDDWYSYGQYLQYWYPSAYEEWTTHNTVFESYSSYYEATYTSIEYTEWTSLESSVELVDATAAYDISVSEEEITSSESLIESYSEESATEEVSTAEQAAAASEESDEEEYEAADDDDGDGLEEAEDTDDDGDGVADEADADDDNDGVPDDDNDADGTPDAEDGDDDNDGTADEQDDDDNGDGVTDSESDDADNDGVEDAEDSDDDNDGVADEEDNDDDGDGADDEEPVEEDDGGADEDDDGGGGEDDGGGDDGGGEDEDSGDE